jgi:hypothetical protein
LVALFALDLAHADPSIELPDAPVGGPPLLSFDAFHCQDGPYYGSINSSTGVGSEVADDIPQQYAGRTIHRVTALVSEWLGAWIDPAGIEIHFYDGACPPDLAPSVSFTADWASLNPVPRTGILPWAVYEVTMELPSPVEIVPNMSMSIVVRNTWGANAPYCGVVIGNFNEVEGCGGIYMDIPPNTPRWTAFSTEVDVAFCLLESASTPAPGGASEGAASWGRIKESYR